MRQYLFLLLLLALFGCDKPAQTSQDVRYKIGDNGVWHSTSFSDANWKKGNGINGKAVFWIRYHLQRQEVAKPIAVKVIALGSYQIYLNGNFLGESGRVGNYKYEIPGKHVNYFLIPDSLAKPQAMLIALRISNFNTRTNYSFFNIKVGSYREMIEDPFENSLLICMLAGSFLIGIIYYSFLYFSTPKETQFLFFAVICLLFFLLMTAEYLPRFLDYTYPYQTIRLQVIGWLTFCIAFAIPMFLNREFKLFKEWILLPLLAGVLLFIHFYWLGRYDLSAKTMSLAMWSISLILGLLAGLKRLDGALVTLAAVLLSGILSLFLYYDYSLFISFAVVMISMLYLLSVRAKKINTAYTNALLISERLKIELLKKSIQPHFIMNTLTSLIDWIEESPAKGVDFIHALALEFEVLAEMTDLKMVPIEREIELCKTHLKVMAYRKEIAYVWSDTNIDANELIPPAIFHTLVENGITHSLPQANGKIEFNLSFSQQKTGKTYTLKTMAINRPNSGSKNGTGLAYVEARLTESFGNQWVLISEPSDDRWCTTIKLTLV